MEDAHGRSVFETNKVNNCPVLNIYIFPYVQGIILVKHCKLSFSKHRDLFLFHTQLFYWCPGQRAETELLECCGGRPLHFGFCIHLLFLHTTAIDEAALWISELPRFEHNQFPVFKWQENGFLKTRYLKQMSG